MIGIDTNVLVRFLVEDDEAQAAAVNSLLSRARRQGETVFISLLVLLETEWVLRSAYRSSRAGILAAFESLLATDVFECEESDVVRQALEKYRNGPGDFADYLIAGLHAARGCRETVTFDHALRRAPGFRVLK